MLPYDEPTERNVKRNQNQGGFRGSSWGAAVRLVWSSLRESNLIVNRDNNGQQRSLEIHMGGLKSYMENILSVSIVPIDLDTKQAHYKVLKTNR